MRDVIRATIGIILAFAVYTLFEKLSFSLVFLFNVFSLVVFYFAMEKGESTGAVLGMVCGLIQDSFSMGVFGIAGIAKTISGFGVGYMAKRFRFGSFKRKFVFLFVFSALELLIWSFLFAFILSERINTGQGLLFFQPLGTAVLGSAVFPVLRRIERIKSGQMS